jgi:hypothetical protein
LKRLAFHTLKLTQHVFLFSNLKADTYLEREEDKIPSGMLLLRHPVHHKKKCEKEWH